MSGTLARDAALDAFKGVMVVGMLLVHPPMMMTDMAHWPGLLAAVVTVPIAPGFLFALGYAMGLRRRPMGRVLRRSGQILAAAIAFGLMLRVLTGEFLFSVLFTAAVGVLLVGWAMTTARPASAMAALGIGIAAAAAFLSSTHVCPPLEYAWCMGMPESEWKWNTPLAPYVLFVLLGGMVACDPGRVREHGVAVSAGILLCLAPLFRGGSSWYGILYLLLMLGSAFAFPPLLARLRSVAAEDWLPAAGRHVLAIYFLHHLALAAFTALSTGAVFRYTEMLHRAQPAAPGWIAAGIAVALFSGLVPVLLLEPSPTKLLQKE